jgi:hypothetical protein
VLPRCSSDPNQRTLKSAQVYILVDLAFDTPKINIIDSFESRQMFLTFLNRKRLFYLERIGSGILAADCKRTQIVDLERYNRRKTQPCKLFTYLRTFDIY